ncbi:3-demethylubiquinone-9 3-methyltransferase [Chitinasiproducens palmae]|uniref:Ubiquinone biosynthesis O-methyltransferase n=1 Tax=Chitinasiproducens palmae TaxID=1770053 RepID=A0A1H2PV46_9BURK|nr:3-demethylubiquinone-9 3-methyltransferase [Chitinasiproducens palmae]
MNVDPQEVKKFSDLASRWWDTQAEFRPLHEINPLRLDWIDRLASLPGMRVIDIGCGGGILSESMALRGARVKGIDLSEDALGVADLHSLETGVTVEYEAVAAETIAAREPGTYDVVTCMEMLEHVPRPAEIVEAAAQLVRPGGWVFFSTLNRNPKAYLLAVIGAEYIARMLPKGTHDYERFIRPAELAAHARAAGLLPRAYKGLVYKPLSRTFALADDLDVNYMFACQRPLDSTVSPDGTPLLLPAPTGASDDRH